MKRLYLFAAAMTLGAWAPARAEPLAPSQDNAAEPTTISASLAAALGTTVRSEYRMSASYALRQDDSFTFKGDVPLFKLGVMEFRALEYRGAVLPGPRNPFTDRREKGYVIQAMFRFKNRPTYAW